MEKTVRKRYNNCLQNRKDSNQLHFRFKEGQ